MSARSCRPVLAAVTAAVSPGTVLDGATSRPVGSTRTMEDGVMRAWKKKHLRITSPRAALMVALSMAIIGLSLLPEAHSAARQFAVGLELGLAGVVLGLGLLRAALRVWRSPLRRR